MLLGINGRHGHGIVKVFGRGDDDRVDARVGQQVAIIGVDLRLFVLLRHHLFFGALLVAFVGVANATTEAF